MAVYEALLLNTAVPQIQAAQAGDSYVMVVNATTPALRITQTGTGNALEVEDSANPDATPFVVTAAGDVGIGTNAPTTKLYVTASVASTAIAAFFNTDTANGNGVYIKAGGANAGKYALAVDNAASASLLYLDASGNLGLGVTPSANWSTLTALQIKNAAFAGFANSAYILANAYYDGSVFKYIAAAAANRYQMAGGQHEWYRSTSTPVIDNDTVMVQAMTLDASGNFVVGATTAAARLVSAGSSATNFKALILRNGDGTTSSSASIDFEASSGTQGDESSMAGRIAGVRTGSGTSGALTFSTTNGGTLSERARITSGGLVLINRNSPAGGEVPGLHISGSSDTTNTNYTFYTVYNNDTEVFGCRNDGFVRATAVYNKTDASAANVYVNSDGLLYRSTSSRRYKTDVQNATHGLAEVMQLRPVTYKGINNGDTVFGGLIAEEVHAAGLTEFVAYNDANEPDALHYGHMVALLTKAIQEQQAMINELKAEVAALKGA
jgi:hypothetical protein